VPVEVAIVLTFVVAAAKLEPVEEYTGCFNSHSRCETNVQSPRNLPRVIQWLML
jgi:hypothetical protein